MGPANVSGRTLSTRGVGRDSNNAQNRGQELKNLANSTATKARTVKLKMATYFML